MASTPTRHTRYEHTACAHAVKLPPHILVALNDVSHTLKHPSASEEECNLCDYWVVSNRDFLQSPKLIKRVALTFCSPREETSLEVLQNITLFLPSQRDAAEPIFYQRMNQIASLPEPCSVQLISQNRVSVYFHPIYSICFPLGLLAHLEPNTMPVGGGGCHRQIKSLLLMHCSDMETIEAAPQRGLLLNLEKKPRISNE